MRGIVPPGFFGIRVMYSITESLFEYINKQEEMIAKKKNEELMKNEEYVR